MLHSICQQIWKTQQWSQDWKVSFHSNPKERQCQIYSNYHTIALISYASKVTLKILQARLQQYVNRELRDVQARFRKGRRTRDQIAKVHWITEKARDYQTTLLTAWEICMQVKEQYLEQDMEQWTGFKLGKEYIKTLYCHPAYLTSMQYTSWETLGWKKHKLESRLLREISITSDMQMKPSYGRKWRGTKKPLEERERGEWKSWPKAQHSEN